MISFLSEMFNCAVLSDLTEIKYVGLLYITCLSCLKLSVPSRWSKRLVMVHKYVSVLPEWVLWEFDVAGGSDGRQRSRPAWHSVLWVHSRYQLWRQRAQHSPNCTGLFSTSGELWLAHPGHIPSQQLQKAGQTGRYKELISPSGTSLRTHGRKIYFKQNL
jgi:hypothetical protein